jgi:thiamine biosynthesis lipoprotein
MEIDFGGIGKEYAVVNRVRRGLDPWRFLVKDGVRYTHILDPTTGGSIPDAPRSITVAAGTCVEAGMLSTLHGADARALLEGQGVQHWISE